MGAPKWLVDGAKSMCSDYRDLLAATAAEAERQFARVQALADIGEASPLDVRDAWIRVQEFRADLRYAASNG